MFNVVLHVEHSKGFSLSLATVIFSIYKTQLPDVLMFVAASILQWSS